MGKSEKISPKLKKIKEAKFCFAASVVCFALAYVVNVVGYGIERHKYESTPAYKQSFKLNKMSTVFSAASYYINDRYEKNLPIPEEITCEDLADAGILESNPEELVGKMDIYIEYSDVLEKYCVEKVVCGEEVYPYEN